MSEFRTIIDAGRPLFDASAKDPFVLADTCYFGRAPQLFRKIDVLDSQESEVCIIVKCFRADYLFPGKESILQGTVDTDIQRPFALKKVFFYIGDKGAFFKEIIMATTGYTVLFVGSLPGACLITEYIASI